MKKSRSKNKKNVPIKHRDYSDDSIRITSQGIKVRSRKSKLATQQSTNHPIRYANEMMTMESLQNIAKSLGIQFVGLDKEKLIRKINIYR